MSAVRVWHVGVVCLLMTACSGAESTRPDDSAAASEAPAEPAHPGESIYENYCFSCHTTGLSGAPKLGDVEAWAPRIAKGEALLLQTTIEGIQPAMPPRGMCFDCSDEDLAAAVEFMIVESR